MALLSNVAQIAQKRKTYIYAFYRLCRLHNVAAGGPEDFFALPSVLESDHQFRSGLFRLASSILTSEPTTEIDDIVVMVALGVGGPEIAAHRELEVPDDLIAVFRSGLSPGTDPELQTLPEILESAPASTAQPTPAAPASPPESTPTPSAADRERSAPAPVPVLARQSPQGPRPHARPVPPVPTPAPPRRPPILQQALLADPPEEFAPAPGPTVVPTPEVSSKMERLESENLALERRVQEIESRLIHVVHELESRTPARAAEAPSAGRILQPFETSSAEPQKDAPLHILAGLSDPDAEGGLVKRNFGSRLLWLLIVVSAVALLAGFLLLHRPLPKAPATEAPTSNSDTTPGPTPGTGTVRPGEVSRHSPSAPAAAQPKAQAEAEIAGTLARWAAASANNNPVAESSFYAPQVGRYFLRRNVSRQFVLHEKQAYHSAGNTIQNFNIRDLDIKLQSPSSATVSFTKFWSVRGPHQTGEPHSSSSRLWLTRTPEGWKISGEQDLRANTRR